MTFERNDSIDDDVIAALRADARGVPRGSRERVLRRLSLGAAALGATVTVTTGARALVASVIAARSTTVLVSTLGIGIGIGVGVSSGLDLIGPPAPPASTAVLQAAQKRQPPPAAAQAPSLPPARSVPPPAMAAPSLDAGYADPPRRSASRVARPVVTATPTALLPAPGLAAQQALLDVARRSLSQRDGISALSAIGVHRQRFPDTALAEERAALEIRALLAIGRLDEARERLASFERAFSGSVFAPSLRSLIPSAADSVTEAPSIPQE